MVVVESWRLLELGVDELKDLEPDAVARGQPGALDLLQVFGVDLEDGPRRRFRALRHADIVANSAEAEDAGVPFDSGFAVGDGHGDVVYDVVELSRLLCCESIDV